MVNIVIPLLFGFVIALACGPIWIPVFRRLNFGQYIREDGPQAHLTKQGTPTFGGAIFLTGLAVGTGVLSFFKPLGISVNNSNLIAVLVASFGYGFIGFIDDYFKVIQKKNDGLSAVQKIIGLVIVTGILYTIFFMGHRSNVYNLFSFSGIIWLIVFLFIAVAITNSTNLTDGIDGLCGTVTLVVSLFFSAVALKANNPEMLTLNLVMAGSLVGYLVYNWHPAKVFMGDMGSLAIGGYVLVNAVVFGIEWYIPLFGLIYVIESLSVIIQVSYFKISGGKRFFKMAPIHHHFEASGYNEIKIVALFALVTLAMCIWTYWIIF